MRSAGVSDVQSGAWRAVAAYVEVLKPRETLLLTFIGICGAAISAALAPGGDTSTARFLMTLAAIVLGSAGVNGLTNYADREVDALMERTRCRALPSGRIQPAIKVLPLTIGLTLAGLALAWLLHPAVFAAGLVGTLVAVTWRKTITCVFPQGAIAGCAPLLVGWLAFSPRPSLALLFVCLLISVWIPLHVWSVMISRREEYLGAGLKFFPIRWETQRSVKLLLVMACLLYAVSLALYFVMPLGLVYLATANVLGLAVVFAAGRLLVSGSAAEVWRVYRLSAFPYLGLLFLAMPLDLWL